LPAGRRSFLDVADRKHFTTVRTEFRVRVLRRAPASPAPSCNR
jgi:hypothetical protein